ncbi:OsmC family protein [Salinactinospora qingdaonensis]|uniref:OsmC-like protein n=1 Tax=Salinactinospora qingdaonensis TaxID=702744 RepID=A0ABP7FTJ9_9ACTN
MTTIAVTHCGGDAFTAAVRGHHIRLDQPLAEGGEDTGPTPVEVFVAALAGCVAHYAHRYLARHHLDRNGLTVEADYGMSPRPPARVEHVRLRVEVPGELTASQHRALLAVVDHCTVHTSLRQPPEVRIDLETKAPVR